MDWRKGWMCLVSCLVLWGCGSTGTQPPSEAPGAGDRMPSPPEESAAPDGGTTPPDAGMPPPDGGSDGGTAPPRSGLEGAPTLAPAACVPWTEAAPPVRASACEVFSEYDNPSSEIASQRARYDADSRLLELRSFARDGALLRVETHRWVAGREVFRRTEWADGDWSQSEWFYDAEGRLLRRVDGSDWVSLYSYDAAGRLERVTRSGGGQGEATVYRYDEAGRVLSIDSGDACDRDLALCERYTYWPNGQPRQINRWNAFFWSMDERYDESGRLSSRNWSDYDVGGEDLYTYDAAGRLSRYWVKDGRYIFSREAITTSVYDSRGLLQLQRYAEDNVTEPPPVGEPRPEVFGYIRLTRRVSYICGTQIVALDEWDSDEDGVVDARRTHERDATGRLVRERYSGTPRLDKEPIRRDFIYECD